jgi:hypothetical protein
MKLQNIPKNNEVIIESFLQETIIGLHEAPETAAC